LPPAGHSSSSGDCDDAAADTYPGAQERCGGGDEDCDGLIDDADLSADLSTGLTAYPDADGDGYGTSPRLACDLPAGHALLGGDCDEGDAAVNPAASERCDGLDNDCDGLTDDDDPTLAASSRSTWYADVDEDGHGDSARSSESCLAPSGFISTAGDCDDGDEDIHPSAQERCDGLDNDCDTLIDDADSSLLASSRSDWYPDLDGDGYGLSSGATAACAAPVGHAALGGDCDDDDSDVHPGAMELCGGADEDCDALVDDADPGVDLSSASSWFADEDLDGDGDPRSTVQACAEGVGRVDNDDDCDDRDPAQGPCGSCQEVLDGGLSSGDGLYELDPCGTGLPRSYWCDMSHDGGGWTLAGWQSASATTMLGHADRGTVGSSDWSMDLSCVAYDQVAVFNLTHGQFYSQSYSASTWTAATGNQAIGPAGTAFKQGTYGPSASQIVMGCVDYTYGGGTYAQYACDNDSTRGQRGHIADYAGEFCSGGRLDYTWAWTDGSSCTLRGSPYTWGIAIR
jgi:hypothetical protein